MSTPVVTDRWAGQFDCDSCRRKRLVGDEFSKKALERYRKSGGPLKCKQCVAKQEQAERQAAAAKRESDTTNSNETRTCASCQECLPQASFNRNQWNKGDGKSKCRTCVTKMIEQEAATQKDQKEQKLREARERVQQAKASGSAQQILKAESELAALEAEKVTGLKPVSMKSRGGRGGGGGRGRTSFRSSGAGRGRGSGRSKAR